MKTPNPGTHALRAMSMIPASKPKAEELNPQFIEVSKPLHRDL